MSTVTTLADLVHDVATTNGDKTAIIFQDTEISYSTLDLLIERAADALAARGVTHGDRIALMIPNIPHFAAAYYAVARLGAVTVPLNLLYKSDEIAHILGDSGARKLIVFETFYPQAAEAARRTPSVDEVIIIAAEKAPAGATLWKANPPFIEGEAPRRAPVTVAPGDLAVICYTSGTTGKPKGAMLTHRNFIANAEQVDRLQRLSVGPDDVLLLVLPLFHIFAMNVGLNFAVRQGGTIDLVARFDAVTVLKEIEKHRCTIFLGAPPMYIGFTNLPDLESYDLSSLRVVNSGAAALPIEVLKRFEQVTGVQIQEGYGLTETAPVSHSNAAGPVNKPGTVGPPIPGVESRVVDEEDREVPIGTEGEIVIRGENVTNGYWNLPEASAETLRGGWFHTGDIGFVDADGYYSIVDRKKDMINAGGFKVWPREVEEVLFAHPAIADATVVGMPDAYAGERPLAYVVRRAGQDVSAEDIIAYCKEHMASFKAPSRVEFRHELPKNMSGKVLRRLLRDEARNLTAAAVE